MPSDDILREYGPDTSQSQRPRAKTGGVMSGKDVNDYQRPMGPKNINDRCSPGLHGSNHGNENGPDMGGRHSGSPGIGGRVHSSGSQGKHK